MLQCEDVTDLLLTPSLYYSSFRLGLMQWCFKLFSPAADEQSEKWCCSIREQTDASS